jgi:hypothetical protein
MLVFHHIPKTAGSTFNHAVVDANPSVSRMFGADGLSFVKAADIRSLDFLCGHVTFGDFKALGLQKRSVHLSMLREPFQRIVSHFEMAFRDDEIFRDEICKLDKWGLGFQVFYERFILDQNLTNLQCKYFAQNGKFYDAVMTIAKEFHLVGTLNRFDAFANTALTSFDDLGLKKPMAFPKKNMSSAGEDYAALIPIALRRRIEVENLEDYRLWSWLNTRHDGLFQNPA